VNSEDFVSLLQDHMATTARHLNIQSLELRRLVPQSWPPDCARLQFRHSEFRGFDFRLNAGHPFEPRAGVDSGIAIPAWARLSSPASSEGRPVRLISAWCSQPPWTCLTTCCSLVTVAVGLLATAVTAVRIVAEEKLLGRVHTIKTFG
jgi:hypothetical protein